MFWLFVFVIYSVANAVRRVSIAEVPTIGEFFFVLSIWGILIKGKKFVLNVTISIIKIWCGLSW